MNSLAVFSLMGSGHLSATRCKQVLMRRGFEIYKSIDEKFRNCIQDPALLNWAYLIINGAQNLFNITRRWEKIKSFQCAEQNEEAKTLQKLKGQQKLKVDLESAIQHSFIFHQPQSPFFIKLLKFKTGIYKGWFKYYRDLGRYVIYTQSFMDFDTAVWDDYTSILTWR